jgi:hypothetical protein
MSQARRAALHLLNNDWSRAVWKHWLAHVFEPPVDPPMPASTAPSRSAAPPAHVEERVNSAPSNQDDREHLTGRCTPDQLDPPDSQHDRSARRGELRARFEALSDRLLAVEDGLGALLRRSSQRDKSERRAEQQQVELIDTLAVAAERQAAVLEGLLGTVARLEHALSRLEHGLSRVERTVGDRNRRDSHAPQRPGSQFPESQAAPRSPSVRPGELDEADANDSPGINGQLSEMSLSTVLAMLEIERHSGRLKVATDEGLLASFELSEGSVVSSRLSDNDADPLQTLRTALRWKQGRFWFRQQPAEPQTFPPRSIGSLLLEATRQNDESFADVG